MSRPYTILKRILLRLLLLLSLVQRCHHRCCNLASTNVVTTWGGSQGKYHGSNDDCHCRRCHCEMMFLSGITDIYQTVGLLLSLLSSLSLRQHWHLVCFCKGGHCCRGASTHCQNASIAREESKRCCSNRCRNVLLQLHLLSSSLLTCWGGQGCKQ
jgi:hypothetical protein